MEEIEVEVLNRIDRDMWSRFKAKRSSVTRNVFIKTNNDVWVCSYCSLSEDPDKKPMLYMVHYVEDPWCDQHFVYQIIE